MVNIHKIEEINYRHLENIKQILSSNKEGIKLFKTEQAERMKQMMLADSTSAQLEGFFNNFQKELKQKEFQQKQQVKGAVLREIDLMKNDISQELDKIDYTSSITGNSMNNMNNDIYNTQSNDFNPMYDNLMNQSQTDNFNQSLNNIQQPTNNIHQPENNIQQPVNNIQQPTNNTQQSTNDLDNELLNSLSNMSTNSEVPVETKELDEWISEIKNLI